ncbi:MAG: pyridoxal phosphate-dependent aminotransferase [Chitinophagaceae bacterium]|nr:pyridoxal phosphate-dependent aminotransferase [Chitinophagaceae bacterium]
MKFSSLLDKFNEPETLKMAKVCRELRALGKDIIDLSLGEPDFDTPKHIKDAAIKAIEDNWSHYTPVPGFLDLREAICYKFERDNQLSYKPENIIVSTGAKQSIANLVLATVDASDEVVIPTPYWVTYSEIVRLVGGSVKLVRTTLENNYKITPEELESAITPKTRLFMFSSPCNPSGAVYSKEELAALKDVFMKHPDVIIMSDEIYEYINFGGKHESIAQFADLKERVVIVNGLSKGFAMTGWRLGYIAATTEIVKACEKLQGQFTSGTNSIAQKSAVTALRSDLSTTTKMVSEFKRRRERILQLIKETPGFEANNPDGAFYVFPNITALFGKQHNGETINNADDVCMYLLYNANVSCVTGRAFGEPDCVRFSFANSYENIEKAFERIKEALQKLQ